MRSFPGFGTVVSGTVLSGKIGHDDTVELLPSGKQAKVRFIEVHHERVEQAVAGQRVGLNLHSIALDEVSIGRVLAQPGILTPAKLLNAELSLLPDGPATGSESPAGQAISGHILHSRSTCDDGK